MAHTTHTINNDFSVGFTHRLFLTTDVFSPDNPVFAQSLASNNNPANPPASVLAFADQGFMDHWPDFQAKMGVYTRAHRRRIEPVGPVQVLPGGEACKNDRNLFDSICQAIHDAGLCRHSFVVAAGGGAVLDAVGFAASIAHRGVRLVRLPTTTLAQADAGVGVKNGINAFGKKNYLGTFSPPWAVINDAQVLTTLSPRDWRCGFSEVVKVALVKNKRFFEQIAAAVSDLARRRHDVAMGFLHQSAQLHMRHITHGGDPFESANGRPLDFGHWAAHQLEQMSDHRLRHGEAVAIGVALDVTYSWLTGLLPQTQAQAVIRCLAGLGFTLNDPAMQDTATLLEGIDQFRQHLGGRLNITMLTGIGQPIDTHQIDHRRMVDAIKHLADSTASTHRVATAPSLGSTA